MEDNILRGGAEIQAGLELIPQIHLVSHFSCVIFLLSHFSELKVENSALLLIFCLVLAAGQTGLRALLPRQLGQTCSSQISSNSTKITANTETAMMSMPGSQTKVATIFRT